MTIDNPTPKKIHQGRNIKRFREILGIKQEALAFDMGVSQSSISDYESKETLDDKVLEKIAEILKVPAEAIKNFDEDSAINVIANTFNNHDHSTPQFASIINNSPNFNPLDKVVELFERLLESEKEKTQLMKDILDRMK
ncbi:helix-turn-helix transcriptional regulator [Apibacter mensalis]|uniref:helix-turn-helix domain-containing protein n=1 Tax=Apibacter mensalis TaxID=1586267 RepID=UPI0026F0ABD7|nr:helix-turn-helix transcriptional regulator [Apibacter mensalis]